VPPSLSVLPFSKYRLTIFFNTIGKLFGPRAWNITVRVNYSTQTLHDPLPLGIALFEVLVGQNGIFSVFFFNIGETIRPSSVEHHGTCKVYYVELYVLPSISV